MNDTQLAEFIVNQIHGTWSINHNEGHGTYVNVVYQHTNAFKMDQLLEKHEDRF